MIETVWVLQNVLHVDNVHILLYGMSGSSNTMVRDFKRMGIFGNAQKEYGDTDCNFLLLYMY